MKRKTMVGLVACVLLVTASCTAFNIRKTSTNMERETVEETVIGTPEISVNGESVNFSGRYPCKTNRQFIESSNVHTMKDQDGNEYSNSTLIVTVSQDASEEELSTLFDSLGMDVLYKMDRFNMYAVQLRIPATTADELEYYISELERNTDILSVNQDYVMQLDDSSQDMNMSVQ